jgi:hypothetical protein
MDARFALFLVWMAGYVICVGMLFIFAAIGYTQVEALKNNLADLSAVFVPYLGTVVAYWFASGAASQPKSYNVTTFWVALICSVLYNVGLALILASVFFREDGEGVIEQTLSLQKYFASITSFIVAPAVGFFFGKSSQLRGPAKAKDNNSKADRDGSQQE